jgi:hypothetical protein
MRCGTCFATSTTSVTSKHLETSLVIPNTRMKGRIAPSRRCGFADCNLGKNGALETDHGADESVDDHQQRELRKVLAQSKGNTVRRPSERHGCVPEHRCITQPACSLPGCAPSRPAMRE